MLFNSCTDQTTHLYKKTHFCLSSDLHQFKNLKISKLTLMKVHVI